MEIQPVSPAQFSDDPLSVSDQPWTPGTKPLVSICCLTYNHEKFIAEAIEGFLMQETRFPVEILVRDDASTDGTSEIVREYERRFPHLFINIYEAENQWGKRKAFGQIVSKISGKYIAICEGDDYWIDPRKLQKQFEFMEAHQDCSGCAHMAYRIDENGKEMGYQTAMTINEGPIRGEDLAFLNFIPTGSLFFRNYPHDYEGAYQASPVGDWFIHFLNLEKGYYYFFKDAMSVYRFHPGGTWSGQTDISRMIHTIETVCFLKKHFPRYKQAFDSGIHHFFNELVEKLVGQKIGSSGNYVELPRFGQAAFIAAHTSVPVMVRALMIKVKKLVRRLAEKAGFN